MNLRATQPLAPRWASLDDAGAYIGVHPRTIRRMITDGTLTGYRMGKRIIRIDLDEVDRLMEPIEADES